MPTTPDTDPVDDDDADEGAAAFRCSWPQNEKDPTPLPGAGLEPTAACRVLDASYVAYYPLPDDDDPAQMFATVVCERHVVAAVRRGWLVGQPQVPQSIRAIHHVLVDAGGASKAAVLAALAIEGTGDEELDVMASCARLLEQLPPGPQRGRAGAWVGDRYGR